MLCVYISVNEADTADTAEDSATNRAPPRCRACKHPMKGHNKSNCPKRMKANE